MWNGYFSAGWIWMRSRDMKNVESWEGAHGRVVQTDLQMSRSGMKLRNLLRTSGMQLECLLLGSKAMSMSLWFGLRTLADGGSGGRQI